MDAREHQPVLFGKGPSVAYTRGTMYEHQPVLFGKGPSVACTRGTMYEHQPVLLGFHRAQELCESRGGRPRLLSQINLRFLWTQSNTSNSLI